jgi:rubrerythrin
MSPEGKIVELMQVPRADRDLSWLKESLNAAIKVELSTLPPYLCAYWSIQDFDKEPAPPVADLFKTIIREEMLHMGLACNMLTAIGGTPELRSNVPTYPGPLPGGVRPDLTVYISGLTPEFIKDVCMGIEAPEGDAAAGESYESVGAFYEAIGEAFATVDPPLTGENQMALDIGTNSLYAISTVDDAQRAISEIKEQGEGTSASPGASDFGGELPHYYRFAEIYHGKRLIQVDGKWDYAGDPVPFPDAYPMARVPEGGWPNASMGVQKLLHSFEGLFWTLLTNLHNAWTTDNVDEVWEAVKNMADLKIPAQQLMRIPLPDGGGNYGPDFRLSS